MSDFQPGAYDVEDGVFSGKFKAVRVRPEGMALAEQVEMSNRLFDHFGFPRPQYRRRGGRLTYGSHATPPNKAKPTGEITYGALAGPAVVCHEVAHILVDRQDKKEDGYWHGPVWQAKFVQCVLLELGPYHAKRLATAFAKFEADKVSNKAKAAVKRGKRKAAEKAGPPLRETVVRNEFSGKLRIKAMGPTASALWGKPYSYFAIRYRMRGKGWYWMVSAYRYDEIPHSAYESVWEGAARGEMAGCVWTEKGFQTRTQAYEWAKLWEKEQAA